MYMDLVLCKHKESEQVYLFQAPSFCCLEQGDDAIVDTKYGKKEAMVIDLYTTVEDSDVYKFILSVAQATTPLKKVLTKVMYRDLEYGESENN